MPTGKSENEKTPALVVVMLSFNPVPFCSISTVASGTIAPDLSATVPATPPRNVWPSVPETKSKLHKISHPQDLRLIFIAFSPKHYDEKTSVSAICRNTGSTKTSLKSLIPPAAVGVEAVSSVFRPALGILHRVTLSLTGILLLEPSCCLSLGSFLCVREQTRNRDTTAA